METIIPLSLTYLSKLDVRIPFIIVIAALSLTIHKFNPTEYEFIEMPEDSFVLTTSSYLMNSVVGGSSRIHVVPSPNVGWNDKEIQQAIFQIINKGKFDCSLLDNYRFDYLVENNLTETPACAKLERIQKNIRIWRLTP